MKKTISVIIGVIVAIVLIACLGLPKYYSSQNKMFVQTFLTGIQQGSNGQITGKIVKENQGWFSSSSTIEMDYTLTNTLINNTLVTGHFNLQLTTKYGPILFTHNGLKLGQAYLEYTLENNPQSAKYFSDPLLKGNTDIDFVGKSKTRFFGFKSLSLPHFQFDGVTATVCADQSMNHINGKINYGKLQASNPNNSSETINIVPSAQTFHLTRPSNTDFWSGNKDLEIPSILIHLPGFHGQFNNVSLKSHGKFSQNVWNGSITIASPKFTINNQQGNYKATLNLTNLNAAALNQVRSLSNSLNPTDPSYALQLTQTAINVFGNNSVVRLNSKLNFGKLGSFIVNTGYDNSTTTSTLYFTAKLLRSCKEFAGLHFKILDLNKNALGQLVHLGISLNPELNPAAQQQLQNQAQLQTMINNIILQLFNQNSQIHLAIMLPQNEKSGFQFLVAKAFFNQLPANPAITDLITQAQLNANWKIPTYATAMLKIFAPIIINKISDPTEQTNAANAYNLFQQMLPLMIQQGYLTQQGNYYLSSWNITSQSMLMNNKPVLPLIVELKQLQQATTPAGTAADQVPSIPKKI